MRFLVIEEDEAQAHQIKVALTEQGYIVDVVIDSELGWTYVETFTYDLLLVNANLSVVNGINLCQRIRDQGYTVPILLLTPQNSSLDPVAYLTTGADDQLLKPFTQTELFARIRALLRSPRKANVPRLHWHHLSLDPVSREVTYRQQPLSLSPKEYNLLELFLRNPKRVLTQSAILEHLWSFESQPNEDTVRAHVKRLRRKLRTVNAEKIIETVYGVGYRLKPLSAEIEKQTNTRPPDLQKEPLSMRSEIEGSSEKSAVGEMAASWEQFKTVIFQRIQTLEEMITPYQTLTPERCKTAELQAHKLAGSLGIFGLKSGYQLAQQIEQYFIEARQNPQTPTVKETIQTAITQLYQELQHPFPQLEDQTSVESDFISKPLSFTPEHNLFHVLVVDDDLELTAQLQREAVHWNIQLHVTTKLEEARVILRKTPPSLVLLDLVFPDHPQGGFQLLEELKYQFPELPVLVWTVRDEMSDRAAVARLGGKAFLSKSVSSEQVIEAIKDVLQSRSMAPTQILAVDDDPVTLNCLQQLLPSYGLELTLLEDSRLFWQTLEKTNPDLLILDLEMPHFNGVELCQTVRTDRCWNGLPILFLSARKDPETVQKIYQAGADDYISKPFSEAELITRIFNRLDRIHLWRSLAETEAITGLVNRRRSIHDLHRYLHLSQRHCQPFCLVLIAIDGFQNINNQYGYTVGDHLMKQFGQILQRQFRDEDIVGHWGAEGFIVGLYGSHPSDGAKRITQLLELVQMTIFSVANHLQIQITASAGIATYPEDGKDFSSLYAASNAALYRAKAVGGNCLLMSGS